MKDTDGLLGIFKTLMTADNYPIANPVHPAMMADLMRNAPPAEWGSQKRTVYEDIQRLMVTRPDYLNMFNIMDGLEYNGLTLYNIVQAENGVPLWSNIYIRNVDTRTDEIYLDQNLTDKVLIGEDGISVIVYSFADDCFQIRDKVSTDYVIESHNQFHGLLSALIDTVN
ncbi:TPA: YrhA family protein [Enterobacter kobei]